jgi:hypothetical protein
MLDKGNLILDILDYTRDDYLIFKGGFPDLFFLREELFVSDQLNKDLIKSTEDGILEIVKDLLDKGADVNTTNKFNHSPLMLACRDGYIQIVETLLEAGADMDMSDGIGYTALQIAEINNRPEIVELLKSMETIKE